ncbi:GSCFA domain-containing protein [Flavipsychrobacter stenotrophus]|uniref:GSCFA domain-containing protein n=1 Tax=Flavipsychrobacter stenotrophus TaxID=2077091 RepID=A0A2S7SYJ9_9BACT|nr:GSCFA domain-containing protein [Flavipsychrobacter stenotrophus]PQJ11606.1 GSCFA domain-containing protein [Flavipsychrobacter stenotrophus]
MHTLQLDIPRLPVPIAYKDAILLTGSCFTEHIADRLIQHKFNVVSNPNGILFNPLSVADSLNGYIDNKQYTEADVFRLNELWNSWDHHTRFSHVSAEAAVEGINQSQLQAHLQIKKANHLIITLGSSFQYYLKESGKPVANNHRAPSQWFEKRLLSVEQITTTLKTTIEKLLTVNPGIQIIFTISPVRHIRDGVVENNRSKARLIEAVHQLCDTFSCAYYFPAYELLIDILRDYRYYDIDFVHPNFLATSYVWERVVECAMNEDTIALMKQVNEIAIAAKHRPRFPDTQAHQKFRSATLQKCMLLQEQHPQIDLTAELQYFS